MLPHKYIDEPAHVARAHWRASQRDQVEREIGRDRRRLADIAAGCIDTIMAVRPEFSLTLASNRGRHPSGWLTREQAMAELKLEALRFHIYLDRRIFGRSWHLVKDRTRGVWVAEHLETNRHSHGAFSLPSDMEGAITAEEFTALARETYVKLAPFGTIDVKIMDRGWAVYMTKWVRDPFDLTIKDDTGIH